MICFCRMHLHTVHLMWNVTLLCVQQLKCRWAVHLVGGRALLLWPIFTPAPPTLGHQIHTYRNKFLSLLSWNYFGQELHGKPEKAEQQHCCFGHWWLPWQDIQAAEGEIKCQGKVQEKLHLKINSVFKQNRTHRWRHLGWRAWAADQMSLSQKRDQIIITAASHQTPLLGGINPHQGDPLLPVPVLSVPVPVLQIPSVLPVLDSPTLAKPLLRSRASTIPFPNQCYLHPTHLSNSFAVLIYKRPGITNCINKWTPNCPFLLVSYEFSLLSFFPPQLTSVALLMRRPLVDTRQPAQVLSAENAKCC